MKKILSLAILLLVGLTASSQVQTTVISTSDTDAVFSFAEIMPSFPGGQAAFMDYLSKNTKYPKEEQNARIQGTVYISFVVEKDGSITNVRAMKEVAGAPGFTTEAIRVISAMPKWTPGEMNGKKVRVRYTQPIKFAL